MALKQVTWECPCCGAELVVIAELQVALTEVLSPPLEKRPRRKRRTREEIATDEALARAAREGGS